MSPILFRRKKIRTGLTLGAQFAAARTRLALTILEAEKATRVRAKYLLAFEGGQFDDLPEDVYTLGWLSRYAELLGLSANEVCQQYQGERLAARSLGHAARPASAPVLTLAKPLSEPRLVLTPKSVWLIASFIFVLGIAGYVWWQVQGFMAAPQLSLTTPAPDMAVSSPSIKIEGRTDGHALVTINAEPIAIAPDGSFKQEVHLASGMNTIEVAARNRLNKETKKQVRVLATY